MTLRWTALAIVVAAAATPILLVTAQDRVPASADGLVVHEWGTFTSMQGADGVTLEGLHHEEEALPGFVYPRSEVRDCPLRDQGYKGLEVDVTRVTEKMETPVTYFYTDKPGRVRVRVCFNHGLLTQWYPVSDLLGPPEKKRDDGPLDMSTVDTSFLEWKVDVLSKDEGLQAIPAVAKDAPWQFARIPDSNCVRTVERKSPRLGPVETEKFLFYRGLGRFTLPLRAVTSEGGRVTLHNDGADEVRHLVVVHVRDGRAVLDYASAVAPGKSVEFAVPLSQDSPKLSDMIPKLMGVLRNSLVKEGLYEKEAEAMTKTWERSYFHTEGLRVLYVLPEKVTNALLPIAIDPAPRELRRVLVGRLECLTPEVEAEVAAALKGRRSTDAGVRDASMKRLDRLGRFLEPHLRRIVASSKDEDVIRSAKELLKKE
jgi:hypothetical protein